MRHISISNMMSEEILFGGKSIRQALVAHDILLTSIHDTNKAEFEWVNTPGKDIQSICTVVHKIELCQDTDCSSALGINLSGEFKGLGVDKIDVGRADGEDDTVSGIPLASILSFRKGYESVVPVWLRNVLQDQASGLLFDIRRLITNRDLCQTRQIHQCQTKNMRRVDLQVDRVSIDSLIISCYPGRLIFNLFPHLGEVVVLTAGYMVEFGPLC